LDIPYTGEVEVEVLATTEIVLWPLAEVSAVAVVALKRMVARDTQAVHTAVMELVVLDIITVVMELVIIKAEVLEIILAAAAAAPTAKLETAALEL
jgi:ATP:corrinoid adenosyltransferase